MTKNKNHKKKKEKKILSILIGPCGSGKTHYAKNNLYHHERISQDDQGRRGHYLKFLDHLSRRKPRIVIDRMNFSVEQRMNYVIPAKYLGYKIVYYIFNIDTNICLQRMRKRKKHPTIDHKNVKQHQEIIQMYQNNFKISEQEEEMFEINIVNY